MHQVMFKILTLTIISCILLPISFAQDEVSNNQSASLDTTSSELIKQINEANYLRLIIPSVRGAIEFQQEGNVIRIIPLYVDTAEKIQQLFSQLQPDVKYISEVKKAAPNEKINIAHVELTLSSNDLEMFSFFRETERGHVLDLWKTQKDTNQAKQVTDVEVIKPVIVPKVSEVKTLKPIKEVAPEPKKIIKEAGPLVITPHAGWRDYRYGATFLLPLAPLAPEFKDAIDLDRKTPEVFYPITDREFQKDDKEAHLQLVINLYRRSSWGMMYKSMKLYIEKYGNDSNEDFLEYIKANALLKESLTKGDTSPVKTAVGILENIALRSKTYEMRKAINKYLISYFIRLDDYVHALKVSKQLYVDSKNNFDYEETPYSLEAIIYNLSLLNQDSKIEELLTEKTVAKLLPRQTLIAHQLYTLLKMDKYLEVIKIYEKEKPALVKPINRMILFNVAESYFRNAQYDEAIAHFDQFISEYSFHSSTANARLRLALCYDLADKDPEQTAQLYKQTIDRAQDPFVRYEAQIRYVALTSVRKLTPTESDLEHRVFLDHTFNEKTLSNHPILKLLWQVRLRTLIVDNKFTEALAYLKAIPVSSLKSSEIKSFESDGAEVVLGMILKDYAKADYASVIRHYETYQDRYVDKVAIDPLVNFMVAKSYVKLGLYSGFDSLMEKFTKMKNTPVKSFPVWIERPSIKSSDYLMAELEVIRHIRMKEWQKASGAVQALVSLSDNTTKQMFYNGIILFHLKDYKGSISQIENFMQQRGEDDLIDDIERADLLEAYTGSLYETRGLDKFKKVANAVSAGNKMNNETYLGKVVEKINYLYIELLSSDLSTTAPIIGKEIETFINRYPVSPYQGRLQLLLGQAYMAQEQVNEAIAVLDKILKDEKVSGHIKEMARSELTMARIRQRTI
jgi:outer membrane protein assembly factor BamD (BamD/ComL family)